MRKLLIGVVLLLGLTACGQAPWEDSLRDYEDARVMDPGEITLYNNIDKHPNIARVCAGGIAFATTTRPDFGSVQRIPEWDTHCATTHDKDMK